MIYKPAKVYSAALSGLDAQIVEVEADVSVGLNSFQIVGLPDKTGETRNNILTFKLAVQVGGFDDCQY